MAEASRGHPFTWHPGKGLALAFLGRSALIPNRELARRSLRSFDPEAVLGGHFLSFLARTPHSLALLLEAAGPAAQKHVGRLLGARVLGGF